jgi:hypothetical protein
MKRSNLSFFSCAAEVIGFGLLVYALQKITEGGIYADEHGLSGPITGAEVILLLLACLLVLVSIAFLFVIVRIDISQSSRELWHRDGMVS